MNSKGKKGIKNKRNDRTKRNKSRTDKQYLTANNTKTVYNYNIHKDIKFDLIQKNLKKYNYNKQKYELLLIDQLLCNANCRLVSIFKERMITDYIDEFLHRRYATEESRERLPKFYKYYKNYLVFFCKPIFKDFDFNKLIQNNGEKKAELYYKNNYQQAKSLDNIKDNGFEESDSDSSSDSENNIKFKKDGKIFNDSVKEKLENVTIMTTISNGLNNTVNLNIDNEKLEVFSENKYDKSNDTTVVDFINNYQKELENKNNKIQKNKNKKNNKKFNHSYILRNYNFSRQKNTNNKIYATSYKVLTNDKNTKKNKLLKIKHNKNKSNDHNEIKPENKTKKISIEKILKSNFSNIKDNNKYRRELTNSQKETPKINISLKMIHKGYYKLENEMKNNLINYRNHLKDKLNRKGMTTLSTTPFYNKNDNKSRNSHKILYKQSSIGTVSNSVYGTQNIESRNVNSIFSINNKSYNFSSIALKMKKYKKNIKFINNKGYAMTNLSKKKERKQNKVNNLFIKTDNTKLLNQINISNNQNISNTNKEITSENIKNYHNSKNFIRINKNDKLFKKNKNSLKKNNLKNITSSEIKSGNNKDNMQNNLNMSNNNNNSKEKKIKLKMYKLKTNNQGRNYASYSSLNNYDNGLSTKSLFSKNKSINYNSTNNLINHNIFSTNQKNKNKCKNKIKTKSNNKKRNLKNISSNLMHISLPLLNYNNKFSDYKYNNINKNSQKYLNSNSNKISDQSKKIIYNKNNNSNSITNILNFGSKYKQIKNRPNSKSINKTDMINNSSNKNQKFNKTIASYITKSITNYRNIYKRKNLDEKKSQNII